MRAVGVLQKQIGAGFDMKLAGFEIGDEIQLLGREVAQHRLAAQRTLLAGGPCVRLAQQQ